MQRDKDLGFKVMQLGFSVQFTQCKHEAANSLSALKPWQYLSIRTDCCRHHNQLSKLCAPTLSCDQLNQSCLAEGKIAPESKYVYLAAWGTIFTAWVMQKYWYQLSAMKKLKHQYQLKNTWSV